MSVTKTERQRYLTVLHRRKRELVAELESLPESAKTRRRIKTEAIAKVTERITQLEKQGAKQ